MPHRLTLLRIPHGVELTPELQAQLTTLFPNSELVRYESKPNYEENIRQRIKSLDTAFAFLLAHYPLPQDCIYDKEEIRQAAQATFADCKDSQHETLERYTVRLAVMISRIWGCQKIEDAMALLEDAELFHLLEQSRPHTVTVVPLEKGYFTVQVDKAIPSSNQQFVDDVTIIAKHSFPKHTSAKNDREREIPAWYWSLPLHQKHFLAHLHTLSPEQLKEDIFNASRLRTMPLLANPGIHENFLYSPDYPNELNKLGGSSYHASHVASRTLVKQGNSPEEQEYHCRTNYKQLTQDAKRINLFIIKH